MKYPKKILRRMSKKKQERNAQVKPFVKVVNQNHLLATRYTITLDDPLKNAINL